MDTHHRLSLVFNNSNFSLFELSYFKKNHWEFCKETFIYATCVICYDECISLSFIVASSHKQTMEGIPGGSIKPYTTSFP